MEVSIKAREERLVEKVTLVGCFRRHGGYVALEQFAHQP